MLFTRVSPVAGDPGLCAVVPTGSFNLDVPEHESSGVVTVPVNVGEASFAKAKFAAVISPISNQALFAPFLILSKLLLVSAQS